MSRSPSLSLYSLHNKTTVKSSRFTWDGRGNYKKHRKVKMGHHQFIKAEMKKMASIIHPPNAADLVFSVFFLLRPIIFEKGNPLNYTFFFFFALFIHAWT